MAGLSRTLAVLTWLLAGGCDGAAGSPGEAAKASDTALPPAEATADATPPEPPYAGPPKTVLVELFSSQGCNSCPEADALIGEFPDLGFARDAVVPLTFHVTYWDDLGWSDPYASPLHDQRQIAYGRSVVAAKADDETTIQGPYTPQMIVDGRVHFSGSLRDVAKQEIAKARLRPTPIELSASATPSSDGSSAGVTVTIKSKAAADANLDTDKQKVGLFAALAQRQLQTSVPRGENAGRTLQEFSVVRALAGPKLFRASRENETAFELALPAPTDANPQYDVVVFAQDLATLQILATERIPVDPAALG